jgi:ribosomal protein L40E
MSGQPGDGCDDPRNIHPHWCGFCGAELLFSAIECRSLMIVPPCRRCRSTDWRSEVDEMTAPDYREP